MTENQRLGVSLFAIVCILMIILVYHVYQTRKEKRDGK